MLHFNMQQGTGPYERAQPILAWPKHESNDVTVLTEADHPGGDLFFRRRVLHSSTCDFKHYNTSDEAVLSCETCANFVGSHRHLRRVGGFSYILLMMQGALLPEHMRSRPGIELQERLMGGLRRCNDMHERQ
jgi:hypothetical protein